MHRFRHTTAHRKQNLRFRRVTAGRGTAGEHGLPPPPPQHVFNPSREQQQPARTQLQAGYGPSSPRQPRRRARRPRPRHQHPAGRPVPGAACRAGCRGPAEPPRPAYPRRARGERAERAQLLLGGTSPEPAAAPGARYLAAALGVPGLRPRHARLRLLEAPTPAPQSGPAAMSAARCIVGRGRAGSAGPAGGGHGPVRASPAWDRSVGVEASLPALRLFPHATAAEGSEGSKCSIFSTSLPPFFFFSPFSLFFPVPGGNARPLPAQTCGV